MFRIWGGGIIEDETFYQLCDREGIMIWQDFIYACAEYPTDPEFLFLAEKEGERIVQQLRNHPSLVLWCGDNENEMIYGYLYPIQKEILKDVCARLDTTRPYWPSSPHGRGKANDPYQGDTHNYHHGDFYKGDFYSKDESRFVSEIGHLSIPKLSTLRSFLPSGSIWPPESRYWSYHTGMVRYADPARLILLMKAVAACGFEYPQNVKDAIRITQLIQAVACQYWIEHYRQRKFLCSGILIWNMSDAWPQISDAITDYFLNPKIAYFYIKRAYTPVLISFKEKESKDVELWLINDTLRSIQGKVQLKHLDFTGKILKWQELDIQTEANSAKKIKEINLENLVLQEKRKECLYACFFDEERKITENRHFFVEINELSFPHTTLTLSLESVEEMKKDIVWKIKISTDNYAWLVELTSPDSKIEFSDNYFDLLPKEEYIIKAIIKKSKNEGEMYPRIIQAEAWNSKKTSSILPLLK